MKKGIIIGASSGIGRELAKLLSKSNYTLGLAARRTDKLMELQKELSGQSFIRHIDVTNNRDAKEKLKELIEELGGLDLIIISSSAAITPDSSWEHETETIEVNICGFMAVANEALKFFINQDSGHIVGISAAGASRGSGTAPAYSASKAFVVNYLAGIRQKISSIGANITITEIRPGNSGTGEGLFGGVPVDKAAMEIYKAIIQNKKYAYITNRSSIITRVLSLIPNSISNRFKI